MKARVLHLINTGLFSPYFLDIARHCDRSAFSMSFCTLEPRAVMHDMLEKEEIQTFSLNACTKLHYPGAVVRLGSLLKKERIDILQTHLFPATVVGALAWALRRKRVKVLLTRHYSDESHIFYSDSSRRKRTVLALESLTTKLADIVIANSNYTKEVMVSMEGAPPEKIEVIPYGMDFSRYRVRPQETESLRKEIDLGSKTVLGVAARLTEVKGHHVLFKALSKLSEPNLVLLIIGTGPKNQQLQDLAKTLDIAHQTRFIGFQENLPAVFSALDILVHPSFSEGLGQVIMEGMLMGLPIVASPVKPIDELVTDKVHGLLFGPGDADALANCLKQLLAYPDHRKAMGAAGKKHALEHFGIERMIRAYEAIYKRLIE